MHNGWDDFEDEDVNYGFLGGATWTSDDRCTSVAFAITAGDEPTGFCLLHPPPS